MTDTNPEDAQSWSHTQPPIVLVVEDNPGDARLIEEVVSASLADGIHVTQTGEEALDFVNRRDEYESAPHPDLILLDWHLPGMAGADVLEELNNDPDYNHIPVIVMTGSQSEREVRTSYKQNANACISKKARPDELEETLRAFEEFWLSAARLPCPEDGS